MKTAWDYTDLAQSYLKRPNYAPAAIKTLLKVVSPDGVTNACDVGAGVAHLTIELAPFFKSIHAVEPNSEMRKLGKSRTTSYDNVTWFDGTGESTGQASRYFDLCTFGSSFNVCDRMQTLKEVKRILKPNGWFACMWNHRDLDDPIQANIESIIKSNIEGFGYGQRREDQTKIIESSEFFNEVVRIQADVGYDLNVHEVITAWRSHASLQRQAGDNFEKIISEIEVFFEHKNLEQVRTPYTTRIWLAKVRD